MGRRGHTRRRGTQILGGLFALILLVGALADDQPEPPARPSGQSTTTTSAPADQATTPRVTTRALRVSPPAATPSARRACDPNYSGRCLTPDAGDYDCRGGSGNGPNYTGRVQVVGVDRFGLDDDGDGVGCN